MFDKVKNARNIKNVPLNVVISRGIQQIRASKRAKELEPYAKKLEEARDKKDYEMTIKTLAELGLLLDGRVKKGNADGCKTDDA